MVDPLRVITPNVFIIALLITQLGQFHLFF